jgi:hypothetical protein
VSAGAAKRHKRGAAARSCIANLRLLLRDEFEAVRKARAALVWPGVSDDLAPSVIDGWPERRFSARAWQATPYWIGPNTTNESQRYVYKNLARRRGRLLDGRTAAEILSLLGPPHTDDRLASSIR